MHRFHGLLCLLSVLCWLQDGAATKLKKDGKEKKDKDKKDKKEKHKHGDDDEDFPSVRMLSTTALPDSQDMPKNNIA